MKESEAYIRRYEWYNALMTKVNKYAKEIINDKDREKGINELLTKAIVDLEKTVNPNYSIDNDPATKKRLAGISQEIAKDRGIKLRKGEGEERRNFIKRFSIFESTSDFFDNRHKAIIAKQESNGIPYRTEPGKPKVQPVTETRTKPKTPVADASSKTAPTTSTLESRATSSVSRRNESASVVDSEKERTSSKTEKPKRKATAPTSNTSVTRSGVMTDKEWDKAVANESRRVADLGKAVVSASSKPDTSDAFKKKQAMLVKGLYDHTNVNAAVKVDRRRERELGGRDAVREDKARREREERSSAAINSGAATTTGVHPSKTPPVRKTGNAREK